MDITTSSIKSILLESQTLKSEQLESIHDTDDLRNYGLNSMNSIELIVKMEDLYGFAMEDDDLLLDNISTINNIAVILKKYL
jgi:acyl carrier protein